MLYLLGKEMTMASRNSFAVQMIVVVAGLFLCTGAGLAESKDSGWISLFNGKDLSGWYTFLNTHGTNKDPDGIFTVEDGVIHAYKNTEAGGPAPLGFLSTEFEYSHYHLRFQYKWGKKRFGARANMKRDSGLMYHAVGPDGVLQETWPRSLECQVQETDTGDVICIAGARCTVSIDPAIEPDRHIRGQYLAPEDGGVPSTSSGWSTKSAQYDTLEGWNTVDVIVMGSDYAVYAVNGHVNHRLTKLEQQGPSGEWVPLERGRILLQAELAEVFFRNVKIKPLPTGPFRAKGSPLVAAGDGSFALSAAAASLGGPSLRFQPDENSTLGHWHDVEDRASWTINVPKSGRYAFELDWSVGDSQAGKNFRVVAGDVRLEATVLRTGGWWTYKKRVFGELYLKAGVQELTVEPAGDFKGALMDIRTARLVPLSDKSPLVAAPPGHKPLAAHADGTFKLPAAAAILSGPSLRFQPEEHDTLGHWHHEHDQALWTIEVEEGGQYAFELDWSVDNRQAGKTVRVSAGDSSFEAKVPGTGGWWTYQKKAFGHLDLSPGVQQVIIQPASKFQGALMDLRMALLVPAERSMAPRLKVPDGFQIDLVAGQPLVKHPMMVCMDDRGRLFVAESAGINRKRDELLKERPHQILLVEDTDGDGKFDHRSVFVDKVVLPNGGQWHDGALYVCSAPYLWRFEDADGDGRAERQERILGRFDFTGMSDSMHGPVLGPDGRLYISGGQHGWGLGDPAADPPLVSDVPGVFSCRPDGSDPEVLGHGGFHNPVEVTFTSEGEVFGTVAVYDKVDGRHDAMLHWIYGGVYNLNPNRYPKVTRTGDVLHPFSYRGHVAPAGNTRYRGAHFGPEYRNNIFLAEFNTHKVYRVLVERDGASFRSRDEVFLSSSDMDTHFTDVMEDADGSLLVVNTGGWFPDGCPTSQISKPDILGGIYRITKKGGPVPDDPRGLKIAWKDASLARLAQLMDDDRFVVRDRAIAALAKGGVAAVPILAGVAENDSARARRNAVWALTRIDHHQARAAVRSALTDEDFSVRLAAARSVSTWRDADAFSRLVEIVTADEPALRRESATALGRIGKPEAVPSLIASLRTASDDRFLEHALTYALMEIDHHAVTLAGLRDPAPHVRRAVLIAMDGMERGQLTRELVAPLLDTDDEELQQTALEVISRHADWAEEITGLVGSWLAAGEIPAEREAALRGALLAFAKDPEIQKLVGDALVRAETPAGTRLLLLEVMARSELEEFPSSWYEAVASSLRSRDPRVLRQAVVTIAACGEHRFDQRLASLARDPEQASGLRVAAAAVVAGNGKPLPADLTGFLLGRCRPEVEPVERLAAARALGRARLDAQQLSRVAKAIAQAGALELPSLVGAFEQATSADTGSQLVVALGKSPGLTSLPAPRLTSLLGHYPEEVRSAASPLLEQLNVDRAAQAARLGEFQEALTGGDVVHGRAIFEGKRASCLACHTVGSKGGNVGPNLSQIGKIRTRRDLLEAVIFPSASFARGYEPLDVVTNSGQVYSGVIGRETAEAVYLRTAAREEIRLFRGDVIELAPSTVSVMPQGLDKTLTRDEVRDLLAYLASLQ
jgi:putative membrane-bound dehydrogenase-like protein